MRMNYVRLKWEVPFEKRRLHESFAKRKQKIYLGGLSVLYDNRIGHLYGDLAAAA